MHRLGSNHKKEEKKKEGIPEERTRRVRNGVYALGLQATPLGKVNSFIKNA